MQHRVTHEGRVIMTFTIEDEVITSASEHWTEVYNSQKHEQPKLVQVLGETAMAIGGREGANAVVDLLAAAPKTEAPLILVKKYITDSGDGHKEFVEQQVLRLTEEIQELRNSMDTREVDWGV